MKKSSARRVPRQIRGDDDDDLGAKSAPSTSTAAVDDAEPPSFVKRPAKSRKSSAFRTSFGVAEDAEGSDPGSGVVTPKQLTLTKVAIQRNAERRLAADVPFRSSREVSEERPSYSKDTLSELRHSTPSTPRDLASEVEDLDMEDAPASKAVDLTSKFGSSLSRYQAPSTIPTDAEIQEKKLRRARMAQEKDFISLEAASEDEDLDENVTRDDAGRLILRPKEKYAETRLVRDDEDIFEDFDDFTTDGKVGLGRNAEREAEKRRRAEMASLIAEAEGESEGSGDEDESEEERKAVFADAQTRSGTYASRADDADAARPKTPPKITPLPTFDGVISRLRARLEDMEIAKSNQAKELEGLRAERAQIEGEEVRVQAALKETAERYAELRRAVAAKSEAPAEEGQQLMKTNGHDASQEFMDVRSRGGLGLGMGLGAARSSADDSEDDEDDEY